VRDLANATVALRPSGDWTETELLLKAGEGGSWQSSFDGHPLAPSSATMLARLIADAATLGLRITPYVVVRAKQAWIADEQAMIRACVEVAGRCVLNVEPGVKYWDGPNDPTFIRNYLRGVQVDPAALEVCMIPRSNQVVELGGAACIQAWTDPALVGSASWECYGMAAGGAGPGSLLVSEALPRLDGWGVPPGGSYRIPVVQRDERDRWASADHCAAGMQLWHLDGNL
jgi:hypothetical protein